MKQNQYYLLFEVEGEAERARLAAETEKWMQVLAALQIAAGNVGTFFETPKSCPIWFFLTLVDPYLGM